MSLRRPLLAATLIALVVSACGESARQSPPQSSGELNLYTARHYDADLQLYRMFEEKTGIRINRIDGRPDQLMARMQTEGSTSPADVFVAADAGALWRAQEAGLLQPVTSTALSAAIPANLRDPQGHWFGLARRARVVAYDTTKLVEVLSRTMSVDEAYEYFEFNILGAYVGERTPMFVTTTFKQ